MSTQMAMNDVRSRNLFSRALVEAQAFRKKEERVGLTAGENSPAGGTKVSRRALVASIVVAVHVALLFSLGRGGVRPPTEVVEVSLILVPTLESAPVGPVPKPREDAPRRVASVAPSVPVPPEPSGIQEGRAAEPATAPVAPIDWYAEAQATASAVEQRDRAARERRPLNRPGGAALAPDRHGEPPCPFEKCEPGWGAAPSVFDSTATKKGRIEKAADGEVIRWTSNRCYQILVTANIFHRGMTRCVQPLGKKAARGDLFKHMNDVPPPEDRATDVP